MADHDRVGQASQHELHSNPTLIGRAATGRPNTGEFDELAVSVRHWLSASSSASAHAPGQGRTVRPAAAKKARDDERNRLRTGAPQSRGRHAFGPGPDTTERVAVLAAVEGIGAREIRMALGAIRIAYGRPMLSRAYGDWSDPERGACSDALREHGVQQLHTPAGQQEARIALAIDALDAVRDGGATCVVMVGVLEPALPLVSRLRALGARVVSVAPHDGATDTGRLVDEFVDLRSLGTVAVVGPPGRRRAR